MRQVKPHMADTFAVPPPHSDVMARVSHQRPATTPIIVLFGLLLAVGLEWERLTAVWQTGAFFDSDDAMRLVQVRDYLNGQGWFDLSVKRLAAPEPMIMHWSRIVDVPLSLLIGAFSTVMPPESSERLTRIIFPALMFLGLFGAMIRVTRSLFPFGGEMAAVILTALSGVLLVQFAPGRIDHHAPQIVLLMLMVGSVIRTLGPDARRSGLMTGFFAALSLAISLENLPFVIFAVSAVTLRWIIEGIAAREALAGLACGLPLFGTAFFFLTVAPTFYAQGACDAFSAAHLETMIAGGIGLAGLAYFSPGLPSIASRLAAAAAAGACIGGSLYATFPACLGDPLAGIDPLLREIWLKKVLEARPLLSFAHERPELFLPLVVPIFIGLPAALSAVVIETGKARVRWLFVAGFVATGCVTAFWQIRVFSSLAPISLLGGLWTMSFVRGRTAGWPDYYSNAAAFLAGVPFCALVWMFVPVSTDAATKSLGASGLSTCLSPSSISSLNRLPPSVILAPIDLGSHILALTNHSVIAAPYHRNNSGNLLAVDFFIADETDGRAILSKNKVDYIVLCPGMAEVKDYSAVSRGSVAWKLEHDQIPSWLEYVNVGGNALIVLKNRLY